MLLHLGVRPADVILDPVGDLGERQAERILVLGARHDPVVRVGKLTVEAGEGDLPARPVRDHLVEFGAIDAALDQFLGDLADAVVVADIHLGGRVFGPERAVAHPVDIAVALGPRPDQSGSSEMKVIQLPGWSMRLRPTWSELLATSSDISRSFGISIAFAARTK